MPPWAGCGTALAGGDEVQAMAIVYVRPVEIGKVPCAFDLHASRVGEQRLQMARGFQPDGLVECAIDQECWHGKACEPARIRGGQCLR